jgi:hypothetical protein
VVNLGTAKRGKPIRKVGVSRAAPLIPLNMATLAIRTQTGSMNQ